MTTAGSGIAAEEKPDAPSTLRVPRIEPPDPRQTVATVIDPAVARLRRHTILALLALLFVVVRALNLVGVIEPYTVNRLGRYLCFAIAAIGVDLIWGYAGVLSLCQALFFCVGGYAMAMHLSLPAGGGDVRPEYNNIPQFFFFNSLDRLPFWWQPFASLPVALVAAVDIPAIISGTIVFFIFRNCVIVLYV